MATEQEVKDELIKDLKQSNERALQEIRMAHMEQLKQAQMHARERIDELIKQNDGLLGAVGRLQGEREEAVKKLESMTQERRQIQVETEMRVVEMKVEFERQRQTHDLERVHLKDEIDALKAKIKKQKQRSK